MSTPDVKSITRTYEEDIDYMSGFESTVPQGFGRDSGQRWAIERRVETWQVFIDPYGQIRRSAGTQEIRFFGRRLTKGGRPTGAQHLLYWLHDDGVFIDHLEREDDK